MIIQNEIPLLEYDDSSSEGLSVIRFLTFDKDK